MTRKKLLFLCQTLPFPPDGGVHIRSYHLLRLLAQEFDVTALCFYRQATRKTSEAIRDSLKGLSEIAQTEAFPIPQELSRARFLRDHLRSVTSARVYTHFTHESRPFRSRLQDLLRSTDFELVHVDSLDLSAYLPDFAGKPIVLDHHNVESALLERRADAEESTFRARYIRHQAGLMEREERRWCPQVDLNLTCSAEDAAVIECIAEGARTLVVPNGVDTRTFRPEPGADDGIVFVGGYTWFPNRDGMAFFAESILPLIRREVGDVRVRWIGRAPDQVMDLYRENYGIELTGFVDDIKPFVKDAACFIVPLRVGGGTRLKILDAWAMGKTVVSTRVGAEGLRTSPGENIVLGDDPFSFAEAVVTVLRDPSLRERIGRNARRTAEQYYDWVAIGSVLLERYRSLRMT